MISKVKPLIVIVGPTASGKTSLAIEIAQKFGGEIICADSRTVYRGMDIGTAKPTKLDMLGVPHWGIDLVNPDQRFTVADFKSYAECKIIQIRTRCKIPILVGGTGLYIDSVLFDYQFGNKADDDERVALNRLTIEELHAYCNQHNIDLPENKQNKRYVIRAIELKGTFNTKKETPIENSIVVGITTDKFELRTRISDRIEQMFDNGVVDEAKKLGDKYGWDYEALKGNVYPLVHSYLLGDVSLDNMKIKLAVVDWRLAKRQLTWLRRNKFINWMSLDQARTYLSGLLANIAKP